MANFLMASIEPGWTTPFTNPSGVPRSINIDDFIARLPPRTQTRRDDDEEGVGGSTLFV